MGYQETLLKINKKHQDDFIKELRDFYLNNWNSLAEPNYIIEVKENIALDDCENYTAEKGEKIIYITGERYNQNSIKEFLEDNYKLSKIVNENDFSYEIIPIEECNDFMYKTVWDDEVDSEENIFENNFAKIIKFSTYCEQI